MKLTQNQFFGLKCEMPNKLPTGSTFLDIENKDLYFYNEEFKPVKLILGDENSGDNLGDHTATENLNMNNRTINFSSGTYSSYLSPVGYGVADSDDLYSLEFSYDNVSFGDQNFNNQQFYTSLRPTELRIGNGSSAQGKIKASNLSSLSEYELPSTNTVRTFALGVKNNSDTVYSDNEGVIDISSLLDGAIGDVTSNGDNVFTGANQFNGSQVFFEFGIDVNEQAIENVSDPTNPTDAVNLQYLDNYVGLGQVNPTLFNSQADFPDASSVHGGIAHSHADGAMYFAHGGSWNKLANNSDIPTNNNQLTNGAGYITDYTVTEQDVKNHEDSLIITLSQISDYNENSLLATNSEQNSDFTLEQNMSSGMNPVNSASDVTITIEDFSTSAIPVGTVISFIQKGNGNILVSYSGSASGDNYQTYRKGNTLTLFHESQDNWVILNPQTALDSRLDGEPTGAYLLGNIVGISQADYDPGSPVATTTYIIE